MYGYSFRIFFNRVATYFISCWKNKKIVAKLWKWIPFHWLRKIVQFISLNIRLTMYIENNPRYNLRKICDFLLKIYNGQGWFAANDPKLYASLFLFLFLFIPFCNFLVEIELLNPICWEIPFYFNFSQLAWVNCQFKMEFVQ